MKKLRNISSPPIKLVYLWKILYNSFIYLQSTALKLKKQLFTLGSYFNVPTYEYKDVLGIKKKFLPLLTALSPDRQPVVLNEYIIFRTYNIIYYQKFTFYIGTMYVRSTMYECSFFYLFQIEGQDHLSRKFLIAIKRNP